MKKILAIGVATAALLGGASLASAQEDCLNGWRMIKEQIPVRCDVLPSAFAPAPILQGVTTAVTAPVRAAAAVGEAITAPVVEEPLYTGSIAAAPARESEMPPRPGAPESSAAFVASRDQCESGKFWMMELNSGSRAVACD